MWKGIQVNLDMFGADISSFEVVPCFCLLGESQWSGSSSEEGGQEVALGENDWGEDFQDDDDEEEEVVELREEGESRLEGRVSALFSYSGEEEGTLALEPGQQFRWKNAFLISLRFQPFPSLGWLGRSRRGG